MDDFNGNSIDFRFGEWGSIIICSPHLLNYFASASVVSAISPPEASLPAPCTGLAELAKALVEESDNILLRHTWHSDSEVKPFRSLVFRFGEASQVKHLDKPP